MFVRHKRISPSRRDRESDICLTFSAFVIIEGIGGVYRFASNSMRVERAKFAAIVYVLIRKDGRSGQSIGNGRRRAARRCVSFLYHSIRSLVHTKSLLASFLFTHPRNSPFFHSRVTYDKIVETRRARRISVVRIIIYKTRHERSVSSHEPFPYVFTANAFSRIRTDLSPMNTA